jgi:hypothetical protein
MEIIFVEECVVAVILPVQLQQLPIASHLAQEKCPETLTKEQNKIL